jgi:hypothetical protein
MLYAAHQQLGGPIVLASDNLNTHVSQALVELVAAPLLADDLPAAALWPRAQPGETGVVA